jgi:hypothetical protein
MSPIFTQIMNLLSWIVAFLLLTPLSHSIEGSLLRIEVFLSDSVRFSIGRSSTVNQAPDDIRPGHYRVFIFERPKIA